jgi:hypothetical protein
MIALHWRPALGSLTGTGRRQRSERRSPSTDFALPPGSPSGPGTQTGPGTADWLYWRPQAQAHASPPSLSRLDSCGPGTRARPPMLPTPCPTRTDFSLCGRAGLLSPVVFLLYRPHRHRVSLCCCSPLSLVRPLACLPSGSPVAPPVSAGLCFSPTAIWDLKCLPASFRSLELLLHPYHRQNFFAVHSLASWIALPTNRHLECCPSYRSAFARRHSLLQRPSLNANRLERHLTSSD